MRYAGELECEYFVKRLHTLPGEGTEVGLESGGDHVCRRQARRTWASIPYQDTDTFACRIDWFLDISHVLSQKSQQRMHAENTPSCTNPNPYTKIQMTIYNLDHGPTTEDLRKRRRQPSDVLRHVVAVHDV